MAASDAPDDPGREGGEPDAIRELVRSGAAQPLGVVLVITRSLFPRHDD
jgi:hypothetical protein